MDCRGCPSALAQTHPFLLGMLEFSVLTNVQAAIQEPLFLQFRASCEGFHEASKHLSALGRLLSAAGLCL